MQISTIGEVATIKSNIKFADLVELGEVSVKIDDDHKYTVRTGHVMNDYTMSFNNANADGYAICQIVDQKPTEMLMTIRRPLEMFKAYEAAIIEAINTEKAAKAAFVESIVAE